MIILPLEVAGIELLMFRDVFVRTNHQYHIWRFMLSMSATISKGQIVKAVSDLPEDATVDDAIERLLLLSKIEQGLEQAHRGETIPHDEVKRRVEALIASWQS